MLKFRLVDYAAFKDEAEMLRQMHFLEVAQPRGASYGMADDFFEALGDDLRIIHAYADETLVGYVVSLVTQDIHDVDNQTAFTDLIYLLPDFRKGRNGLNLLRCAEADLAAYAPGAMWRAATPLTEALDRGKVLEYLGFGAVERLYEKRLAGAPDEAGGA